MTDLTTLLEEGDPVRTDGELSPANAERMRRRTVAPAREPAPRWTPWRRPLVVCAIALLLVVVGTMRSHRTLERSVVPVDPVATFGGGGGDADRRQLQFATPGGTRIIWIFDDKLRLQESMP